MNYYHAYRSYIIIIIIKARDLYMENLYKVYCNNLLIVQVYTLNGPLVYNLLLVYSMSLTGLDCIGQYNTYGANMQETDMFVEQPNINS